MTKLIFSFIILLHVTVLANSQVITGLWQFGSSEVNSGYFDTYQFFSDGTFKFNTDQNDGLRRILTIAGTYKLKKDTIIFSVKYSVEVVGGDISRSEISSRSDSWSIEGGKITECKVKKLVSDNASFKLLDSGNQIKIILIDKRKYYKIDDDPNSFQ